MIDNKSLSELFGYIGLLCWFLVMTPQIYTNYQLKNASSLSPTYILLSVLGNVISCIGAIWGGLIMSTILVTGYLSLLGTILLFQIFYYRGNEEPKIIWKIKQERPSSILFPEYEPFLVENQDLPANAIINEHWGNSTMTETTNLIQDNIRPLSVTSQLSYSSFNYNSDSIKSKRSSILHRLRPLSIKSSYSYPAYKPTPTEQQKKLSNLFYGIAIIGIILFQFYFIGFNLNFNIPFYQSLGWLSSVIFLCSRVPQAYKNYQRKSVEGLSILMFMISIIGNVCYLGAIISYSLEREYILSNLAWIMGAVLGLIMDLLILIQFIRYGDNQLITYNEINSTN